uniref:C2 domain-containing protein n=1 Tax=Leptobrachium leishanense TaxID=445787 RepID=A0A8C5M8T8_9ANUR
MVLLFVKVKRGHFQDFSDNSNTYVTIKVHNMKSSTVCRKGTEPCWEQDYMFDIGDLQSGLLVEVWKSSWFRDTIAGSVWIPLQKIKHATDEGPGEWWTLHSDVIPTGNEDGEIGSLTTHEILLDLFFAEAFDYSGDPQDADCNSEPHWPSSENSDNSALPPKYLLGAIKQASRNEEAVFTSSVAKERWNRAIQKFPDPVVNSAFRKAWGKSAAKPPNQN